MATSSGSQSSKPIKGPSPAIERRLCGPRLATLWDDPHGTSSRAHASHTSGYMPARSTSCGRLRGLGIPRLGLEPGLDFRGLIEVTRWKFAWRLRSRRGAGSRRALGAQERELAHAGTVVAGNNVLVAPGADLRSGPMAKLPDVDDAIGLAARLGLRGKAIQPALEVVIGHGRTA